MKISHECAYCGAIYTVKTNTTKQHHKDIKCPFCEHEEVLLVNGDGGDNTAKKIKNYQEIIARKHKKIEELQEKLNMANGTVVNQIDVINRLNNDFSEIYRSISYKDSEVRRLNELSDKWYYEATKEKIIREYLESKLFKGREDD
jgi:uncharacterized protein YfkK (UPF0435 family)/DNA-directed RNA polymerase subunit RPC12/RpoP